MKYNLFRFHKYWGKKTLKYLEYIIDNFSRTGDTVFDPFLGSGMIALESCIKNRKFIGCDINPIAIEYAKFLFNVPNIKILEFYYKKIKENIKELIDDSYRTNDGQVASHYIWSKENLLKVWIKKGNRIISRLEPTIYDIDKANFYKKYNSDIDVSFYNNSRIGALNITINDLFTKRALRNIDLLNKEINIIEDEHVKRAFKLCLTSGSGQMSNMVFIKNKNDKPEVGSWSVGLWVPEQRFEINVWNTFNNKVNKLLKIADNYNINESNIRNVSLINKDAEEVINKIPDKSIALIVTDPPHSDRIPYLELSAFWNAILGKVPDYSKEIVISNASDRNKNKEIYRKNMITILNKMCKILKDDGYIIIIYNSKNVEDWEFFNSPDINLNFVDCFPINYDVRSILQDSREGALTSDYALIFSKLPLASSTTKGF